MILTINANNICAAKSFNSGINRRAYRQRASANISSLRAQSLNLCSGLRSQRIGIGQQDRTIQATSKGACGQCVPIRRISCNHNTVATRPPSFRNRLHSVNLPLAIHSVPNFTAFRAQSREIKVNVNIGGDAGNRTIAHALPHIIRFAIPATRVVLRNPFAPVIEYAAG